MSRSFHLETRRLFRRHRGETPPCRVRRSFSSEFSCRAAWPQSALSDDDTPRRSTSHPNINTSRLSLVVLTTDCVTFRGGEVSARQCGHQLSTIPRRGFRGIVFVTSSISSLISACRLDRRFLSEGFPEWIVVLVCPLSIVPPADGGRVAHQPGVAHSGWAVRCKSAR